MTFSDTKRMHSPRWKFDTMQCLVCRTHEAYIHKRRVASGLVLSLSNYSFVLLSQWKNVWILIHLQYMVFGGHLCSRFPTQLLYFFCFLAFIKHYYDWKTSIFKRKITFEMTSRSCRTFSFQFVNLVTGTIYSKRIPKCFSTIQQCIVLDQLYC